MKRVATALWKGSLTEGNGVLNTQSGVLKETAYSFKGRFEDEEGKSGTNPEELIAAAHAGCFAMQLSHMLAEAGHPAESLEATSRIHLDKDSEGFAIKTSTLQLKGTVAGISKEDFQQLAEKAKQSCPVSKALKGVDIHLEAQLSE